MTNERPGVSTAFGEGEDERYLRAMGAEGITRMEAGDTEILLRVDVTTRATAFHEWLHRCLTLRHGGFTDGAQDAFIEAFLQRHRKVLTLDG